MASDLVHAYLAHCRAAGFSDNTVTDRGEILRRIDHDLPHGLERALPDELSTS